MTVNVFGLSGLRNAYRSVLSAVGSSEISGASRWLDAVLALGASLPTKRAVSPAAAATRRNSTYFFISLQLLSRRRPGRFGSGVAVVAPHSPGLRDRFGPARRSGTSGPALS